MSHLLSSTLTVLANRPSDFSAKFVAVIGNWLQFPCSVQDEIHIVVVIIITGVIGNVLAEAVLKLFRIEEPIAKGIAIGSSSHAVGTAKAMEIGAVEGAMSSLSIVVCGLLTVIGASLFSGII